MSKVGNYWQKLPISLPVFCVQNFSKKLVIFLKGISAEKSFTLSNEIVYSIKSAGLELPNWKNNIAQNSRTLTGYQGEVLSVELRLLKTILCVTVHRSDSKTTLTF